VKEREVTITREQIAAYADASGDRNPIHLDDQFARSVGLPGVIAHGMLLMGLMASTVAASSKLRQIAVRFGGIVVPGDTVTFLVDTVNGGGLDLKAVNQRGEPVLTKGSAEIAP
jgi:acyl dehydratase